MIPWLARGDRSNWSWGVHAWNFLAPGLADAAFVAGILALGLASARAVRGTTVKAVGPRRPASTAGWTVPACCAVVAALLWLVRESIHFLGDTHLRLDHIRRVALGAPLEGVLRHSRSAPLDELFMLYGGGRLAKAIGVDPTVIGQFLPCLLGGVFAYSAYHIARRILPAPGPPILMAALLVFQGYLQLFAGYQETYGAQLVLISLWYGSLLDSRERGGLSWWSHAWLALACLAHRDSVILLPAHLAAWRAAGSRGRARDVSGAAILAGAGAVLGIFWTRQLGEDLSFLRTSSGGGSDLYPLFSVFHLSNVLNGIFLLAPACIAAVVLAPLAASSMKAWQWLAAIPFWVLAILVRSNVHGLGPIRDWDALAPAGFFLAVLAAHGLAAAVRTAPRTRPLAWVMVGCGALYAGAWIGLNAHESTALARAAATSRGLPALPAAPASLALDALARLEQERNLHAEAARDYLAAADRIDYPRYRWAAGMNLWESGRQRDAFEQFVRAARDSAFREERAGLLLEDLREAPSEPMFLAQREALFRAEAEARRGGPPR